jgi:tripartite-type tricarboxylate transporter receptor subunit TctC
MGGPPPELKENNMKPTNPSCLFAGAVAALALIAAGAPSAAQDFPSRTVKIIVPNPAGGTADALPRLIADALGKVWSQGVIVENRPGAAGNVAAEAFSRMPGDGYTLLASPPTTLAINALLYKKVNYDPTKFKPITILGSSPNVLIVNPKLGVSTVKELIEKARADPGGIAYGSQGIGATSHLTTALFETRAGVKFNHVPYKGTAPAMNDLVGGHISFMFDNLASSLPQHKAGTLEILAVCTPERSRHLPDVPTMSEAGLPGFVSVAWFGLVAPPDTPDAIVDKIGRDVVAVLRTEEMRKKFEAHAAEPMGTTPKETAAFLERERAQWGGVIEKAGLKGRD